MASETKLAVDFGLEVSNIVKSKPWTSPAVQKQIEEMVNKIGSKTLVALIDMMNLLLIDEEVVMEADDSDKIDSMEDVPFIKDCATKEDKIIVILAIVVQNYHHAKNTDRMKAVADGTYVDLKNINDAEKYLGALLSQHLTDKFRKNEKIIVEGYRTNSTSILAEKILTAPNHIYAAVMMKMEGLHVGKGDFHTILEKLQVMKSDEFVDIGNKLALLKTGILLKKSEQIDIN